MVIFVVGSDCKIYGTSLSLQNRRGLISSNISSGIYSFFISHLLWGFRHTSKDLGLHPYSIYQLSIHPCIACHNVSYESFGNRDSYMGSSAFAHIN